MVKTNKNKNKPMQNSTLNAISIIILAITIIFHVVVVHGYDNNTSPEPSEAPVSSYIDNLDICTLDTVECDTDAKKKS